MKEFICRLKVIWHVLTKQNYAFFSIGKDPFIFDSETGKYNGIKNNKVASYSYVDKKIICDTKNGLKGIDYFLWTCIIDFAKEQLRKEENNAVEEL